MNHSNFNKGFTLIELLVVVAIIGLLAAVVLAISGTTRDKATNARIQSQMSSLRNQAEFYTGTGTAVTAVTPCPSTAGTLFETANNGLGTLVAAIPTTNTRCGSTAGTGGSGISWAVAALEAGGGVWCVDSSGVSRDRTQAGVAYTTLISAIGAGGTSCL